MSQDELESEDLKLVNAAKEATAGSWSPYSGFRVGAALRLDDGTVVTGSNQENAAYPSGLCAERTALFTAGHAHPGKAVTALAIAARNDKGYTAQPITPCGACRQVLAETEQAEIEHAHSQPRIDRAQAAFFGSPAAIVLGKNATKEQIAEVVMHSMTVCHCVTAISVAQSLLCISLNCKNN